MKLGGTLKRMNVYTDVEISLLLEVGNEKKRKKKDCGVGRRRAIKKIHTFCRVVLVATASARPGWAWCSQLLWRKGLMCVGGGEAHRSECSAPSSGTLGPELFWAGAGWGMRLQKPGCLCALDLLH